MVYHPSHAWPVPQQLVGEKGIFLDVRPICLEAEGHFCLRQSLV